jgi:putative membrane protein
MPAGPPPAITHWVDSVASLIRATLTSMGGIVLLIAYIFASLAALVHVFIFVMESVLWTRPAIWKRFGLRSQDEAEIIRPMALNQGFYNLFLAIGVGVGLVLLGGRDTQFGASIIIFFSIACMLAASLVLVISNPKLARAAVTQGALPLIAVVLLVVYYATI